MTRPPVERSWYTVRDGADLPTVAAVCRATLLVQRPRFGVLYVDVLSDEPWPADVQWAVDELSAVAVQQHRWDPTAVTLDPRIDHHIDLAAAVAPHTIYASGIAADNGKGVIWSANDTGTSLAFELQPEELAAVNARLDALGVSRDCLVPLSGDPRLPQVERPDGA
jgi:hypothetical protein